MSLLAVSVFLATEPYTKAAVIWADIGWRAARSGSAKPTVGSGKSTMKEVLLQELLGVYVNPDEIEKVWRQSGCIDLSMFKVRVDAEEVLAFFMKSTFLANAGFSIAVSQLRFDDNRLCLDPELALSDRGTNAGHI